MPLTHKEDRVETIKYLSDLNEYHKTTPFSVLQENYVEQLKASLNYAPTIESNNLIDTSLQKYKLTNEKFREKQGDSTADNLSELESIDINGDKFIKESLIPLATNNHLQGGQPSVGDKSWYFSYSGLIITGNATLVVQLNSGELTAAWEEKIFVRRNESNEEIKGTVGLRLLPDTYVGHLDVLVSSADRISGLSFDVTKYQDDSGDALAYVPILDFTLSDNMRITPKQHNINLASGWLKI